MKNKACAPRACAPSDIIDVSLHAFPFEDGCLIYDARCFSIVKGSKLLGAVSELVSRCPVAEIAQVLSDDYLPAEVVKTYLQIRALINAGIFSPQEPPLPDRRELGLQSLTLMLAGGCNMGCKYCFEADKPSYQKLNLLTTETADRVLDWFSQNHVGPHMHLQLYGGEPLTNWPVLVHVVERFKAIARQSAKSHSFYIITNGTLLNEERCDYLARSGVEIQISLDGDPDANKLRVLKSGQQTHAKVAPWIRYLKKIGAKFNVRAVLTPSNADPERAINSLEALGASRATYGVVSTSKEWLRFRGKDLSKLTEAQLRHIDGRTTRFMEEEGADDRVIPANVKAIANRIASRRLIHFHCNAGVTEVTITPDGALYECQRLFGNAKASIESTDWRVKVEGFLTPVGAKTGCSTCFARYNCGGGCKEANIQEMGEDHAWPEYCLVKRKEVEAAIVYTYIRARQRHALTIGEAV